MEETNRSPQHHCVTFIVWLCEIQINFDSGTSKGVMLSLSTKLSIAILLRGPVELFV